MNKRISVILAAWAMAAMQAVGQVTVKDATDGMVIPSVTVMDNEGRILGVTDSEGALPSTGSVRHIRLSHLAYQSKDVQTDTMGNELLMAPMEFQMREVVKQKEKAYCLRLLCYYREYFVNNMKDCVWPIPLYNDGICNLYIFNSDLNANKRVDLSTRHLLLSDEVVSAQRTMDTKLRAISLLSYPERFKNQEIYKLCDRGGWTDAMRINNKKRPAPYRKAMMKRDSLNRTISVEFDCNAPDSTVSYSIAGTKINYHSDVIKAVYRMTDYPKVSQGDLLALSFTQWLEGNMVLPTSKGVKKAPFDVWEFKEYYPIEAEYLTKEEYKEETKGAKSARKHSELGTQLDVEQVKRELGVQDLPDDVQQKVQQTQDSIKEALEKQKQQ